MSTSIQSRLLAIYDDLERLAIAMMNDLCPHQQAVEQLADRLDACIDDTLGLDTPAPQEDKA